MFNLIKSLKSWFAVDRPWAHLRPLGKALQRSPYELAALEALDNELTRNRREIPMSLLWRMWHLAEQAQAKPGATAANRLIDEILGSARWEVQSRSMRGV